MKQLLNAMRLQAAMGRADQAFTRVGLISSYDPGNYCVKVTLQPDGTETGWLPIPSLWVGNGWGLFCAPTTGELVEVHFIDGDVTNGAACLRYFNDSERPLNVPAGECWLVHQAGAYLKLTNDGKVLVNAAAEIDIGNLGNTLHTLVTDAFVALFNGHTHPDAQGGATGAPNQTMGTAHLTTVLKAN